MRARGKERREAIWFRDADVAEAIDAVLFVGIVDWYPPNYDCGACGYATCAEFLHATKPLRDDSAELEFAGPTCNLRDIDLGIAVGSAAKTAAIHSIDCRCQTRIAVAARKLGIIHADIAVALSLSLTHKAVGFDRRIAEVDVDTLDYPPTGTLPVGVEGGERYGGVRNRQQPRRPLRDRTAMIDWGQIFYGAALSTAIAAVVFVARPARTRRRVLVPALAATFLGPLAWNAILHRAATEADGFFVDIPFKPFPVSWQDTGSGVFTLAARVALPRPRAASRNRRPRARPRRRPPPRSPSSSTSTSTDAPPSRDSRSPPALHWSVRLLQRWCRSKPGHAAAANRHRPRSARNTSRFDYASLDPTRHRLYVSHLGASQIVVVDTDGPTVERTLDNVASVHGVLAVPAINRVSPRRPEPTRQ